MAVKKYIIAVDDATVPRLSELVTRLQEAGFQVTRKLEIGVIIGSVEEANLPQIRSLPGVVGVEEDRTIQLPSPESDVV
jgi:hypothetical protein